MSDGKKSGPPPTKPPPAMDEKIRKIDESRTPPRGEPLTVTNTVPPPPPTPPNKGKK